MAGPPQQPTWTAGSVLVQTEAGHALLDPYTTLLGPGIPLPWKIKCVKPPLTVPYDGVPSEATSPPSKKRRKAARELSQNEQANLDLHEELRKWLPDAIEQVRQQWIGTSATRWHSEDRLVWSSNDENQVEKTSVDLVAWGREVSEINALQGKADVSEDGHIHLSGLTSQKAMTGLFERIHLNKQTTVHSISTPAASYMIPPMSGYLMADMSKWHALLRPFTNTHHFNVVLLDPPWRSKSVRRSANYEEMDMYDLYRIRLDDLLQVSARENSVLVGVWVTNHSKCRRFVREKLLPSWGVGNIVDWYWVKITSGEDGTDKNAGGLPVWSFNGPSPRRCYEGLMLGYYNPYHLKMGKELAPNRAFISVPLEHSRKPLVIDLLKPYLCGQSTRVLELFARYTPSGIRRDDKGENFWMSVGNEPLKYNEVDSHWELVQD